MHKYTSPYSCNIHKDLMHIKKISLDHFKVTLHPMSAILWAQTIFSGAQPTMSRCRHPLDPATNSLTDQINATALY